MTGWTLVVPRQDVARAPAVRVFGLPHPGLPGHVLSYTGHAFPPMGPTPWRVAPLGVLTVTLDLDTPVRRTLSPDPRPGLKLPSSPVLGLRDRPWTVEQGGGPSRGIVVALTPPGAYALFGLPLRELANATIGLVDLIGTEAHLLGEQVGEAVGWPARFRVLDCYLTARLLRGPSLAGPVHEAWRRLTTSHGRVPISVLAEEVGWTRQHLNSRFREQVGLSPKTVGRVARPHRAASMLSRPAPPTWAEAALRSGYADQSHLNRDFRALTGCTPTEYLGRPPARVSGGRGLPGAG